MNNRPELIKKLRRNFRDITDGMNREAVTHLSNGDMTEYHSVWMKLNTLVAYFNELMNIMESTQKYKDTGMTRRDMIENARRVAEAIQRENDL